MTRPDLRQLRPWYVLAAMAIAWVAGVSGATRAFAEMSYLRGDPEPVHAIDRRVQAEEASLFRTELVRRRALLEAYGRHHERATPVVVARLLLQLLLVAAAGAVLLRRPSGRRLAIQAMLANALLVVVAFLVLQPARAEAVDAVARDAATEGSGPLPDMDLDESIATYRREQRRAELVPPLTEVTLYLLGLLALSRGRARRYFEAVEADRIPDEHEES